MSKFSEYLEQGIMNSGMTENQLAQISGFARSYIALMRNGQRVSKDSDKMERLLQALNLSIEEYDAIWNEYIQMRMGKEQYQKTKAVMNFMQNFNQMSNVNIKARFQYEIPSKLTLEGHRNIEYLIRALIEKETMKEQGRVSIMMQPQESIWDSILPGICKNNEQLLIEHIVCLEKSTDTGIENHDLYNIELLKQLTPSVVCSASANYKVYYYYDNIVSRGHSGSLFSNMLLTSDHLLCFDPAKKHGMLTDDPDTYHMYQVMFEEHKKNCSLMFQQMEMQTCLQNGTYVENERKRVYYTLATQPCFAVLRVSHMLRRYIKPEYEALKAMLEVQIKGNLEWLEKAGNKQISYCSKSGLLRFVKTGEVDEMALGTYDNLNKIDRKRILQLLIGQIEAKKYELYLIEDEKVKLLPELSIVSSSIWNTVVRYQQKKQYSQIILQEKSSGRIVFEAMEVLMKNPSVLSLEESLKFVKELYENL